MAAATPAPHRHYLEEGLTQDGDGPAGATAVGPDGATATNAEAVAPAASGDDGAGDDAVHLGSVACSIVGMRYYTGVVHQGEWVELMREPSNPYDENAIRVDNMTRIQVGHISRSEAFYLAPFMDESPAARLRLLATLPSRPRSKFRCPVRIDFFGPPERQERLAARLNTAMEYTSPQDSNGIDAAGAPNNEEPAPVEGLFAVAAGRRRAAAGARETLAATVASRTSAPRGGAGAGPSAADLDRLFDESAEARAASLAAAGAALRPPPGLAAMLFPHQAAGVAWALARETAPADSLPPFWAPATEGGRTVWLNSLTNSSVATRPPPVTGGLLADEMGVGKTLQVIALVLVHPPLGVVYAPPVDGGSEAELATAMERHLEDGDGGASTEPARGTLMNVESATVARLGTPSIVKVDPKVEPGTLAAVQSMAEPAHPLAEVKEEAKAEPGGVAMASSTTIPVRLLCTHRQSQSSSVDCPEAVPPPPDAPPSAPPVLSRATVRQLKVAALREALATRGVQTPEELAALRRPTLAALLQEHEAGRRATATDAAKPGPPGGAGSTAATVVPPASAAAPTVARVPTISSVPAPSPMPAVAPVTTTHYGDARDSPARTTLVLAPLSVLSAWEAQLTDLVIPGVLRVAIYHGAGRTTDVAALAENDIIVASYSTLAAEWSPSSREDAMGGGRPPARKKRRSGSAAVHAGVLARVPLRRVILDEAHILRNGERTRLFKAVMALEVPLRWVLTGTPVVNRADDLQPLLGWLRVAPLESRRVWNRAIAWPLGAGDAVGLARLRTVVSSLSLRRTRAAVPALAALLPPATTEVVTLRMTGRQRAAYDLLFTAARRVFRTALGERFQSGGQVAPVGEGDRALAAVSATGGGEPPSPSTNAGAARGDGNAAATSAAGVLSAHSSSILEVITRLRQICAAPALLTPARLHRARVVLAHLDRLEAAVGRQTSGGDATAALSPSAVTRLFAMLSGVVADADRRDCAVCMEAVTDESARILTRCRHTFCEACLATLLQLGRGAGVCPMCRGAFRGGDVTSLGQLHEWGAGDEDAVGVGDHKEPEAVMDGKGDDDSGGNGGSGSDDNSIGDSGSACTNADAAATADTGAKAAAILAMLATTPPDEKTVVFSQFTSFLDLLECSLAAAGWQRGVHYVHLDGSMTRVARAAALGRLRDAPSCRLLVASLTAGGVGISLVAANRVILADPWWNAAAEAQAAERVCRLGQRRPVTIVKLVMEASIEAAMVDLQAAKTAVAQGALGHLSPAQARQAHARRLLRLFA